MAGNSGDVKKEYDQVQRIKAGLISVFPNQEAIDSFIKEDQGDLTPFIQVAEENHLIEGGMGKKAFEAFIKSNALKSQQCTPPKGLNFAKLLVDKTKIKTSIRGLTDWINDLIVRFHFEKMLPTGKVSNVTFSRLQREPANTIIKRNTLRLLSFWFGYKRTHLGSEWNYETLLRLCPIEPEQESEYGVRIIFDLSSRGDVIEGKTVKWLTNELRECIKDLSLFHYSRIQSIHTTCFFLDLPKEESFKSEIDLPRSYGRCIKDAISIAHQVSVRWTLSSHSSPRRMLAIGIGAGLMSGQDIYLQSIIQARLPIDASIRMTDYAHLCVLVNDIRATFGEVPREIEMLNGEITTAWWITGLWNTNYWDLVNPLLTDKMLQVGPENDVEFRKLLWFPDEKGPQVINEKGQNAITVFMKYPQNSLLGLEITRTLYFRNRLQAADEILNIILSADSTNLPARTLRMEIYWLLGFEASEYSTANLFFRRAEKEASLVDEICVTSIEDYFCEYALGKMGKAITILRLIRKGQGKFEGDDFMLTGEAVFQLLEEAEDLFEKGMALSSRGYRSNFFLLCAHSLKMILRTDPDIFKNPEKPISDHKGICRRIALDRYYSLGWMSSNYPIDVQFPVFIKFLLNAIESYDESIFLRTSIPNIKFHFAAILWDFSPILNVGLVKTILTLLNQSCELAQRHEEEQLHLLSSIRCHKEIMAPNKFIKYVEKTIKEVEKRIGTLEELELRDENETIGAEQLDGLVLFSLNI